jgi:hypothetical protein
MLSNAIVYEPLKSRAEHTDKNNQTKNKQETKTTEQTEKNTGELTSQQSEPKKMHDTTKH